jgi:hypothetical protein
MGRQEKIAWYNLVVIGASILLFLIIFFVMKDKRPIELCFKVSSSAFGVLGFLGFGNTLFRKGDAGRRFSGFSDPEMDERDIEIRRKAGGHAFSVFWVLFVLTIMGAWMFHHWKHGMDGHWMVNIDMRLPLLLIPCFIIIVLVQAISTIVQQRSSTTEGNGSQDVFVSSLSSLISPFFVLAIFLIVSLFTAIMGNIFFAFMFATISFGGFVMAVREIRRKQECLEDDRLVHGVKILSRIANIIFTVMYGSLIVKFFLDYSKLGFFKFPFLFVLLFIGLIFYRTVIVDIKRYTRESQHEKA